MAWFVTLAVFVGVRLLAYAMSSGASTSPTEDPTEFPIPKTGEGSPVPMVYGVARINSPAVLWWGDAIEGDRGIGNDRIVKEYFYGMALGVCLPPMKYSGDRFKEVNMLKMWFGDTEAYDDDTSNISLDTENGRPIAYNIGTFPTTGANTKVWGGMYDGGNFSGDMTWYGGQAAQDPNPYLVTTLGATKVPAYRGLAYVVFERMSMGYTPRPPSSISFLVEAYPTYLADRFTATTSMSRGANGVEVILDLLINPWGRLGLDPDADIDLSSFQTAAEALATEDAAGNKVGQVNMAIAREASALDVIQEILTQIDGLIYQEPGTGKITMKLVREDYVFGSTPVFDETNVLEVLEWKQSTWDEVANHVRVQFMSRFDNYKPKVATAHNMSTFFGNASRVNSVSLSGAGITDPEVASQYVTRELGTYSRPVVTITIAVNRDGFNLRPGDVFRYTEAATGINQKLFRVQSYDLGSSDDPRIVVRAVEDEFAFEGSIYDNPATGDPPPSTLDPLAAERYGYTDLPFGLFRKLLRAPNPITYSFSESRLLNMVSAQTANEERCLVEYESGQGGTFFGDNVTTKFLDSAELQETMSSTAAGYDAAATVEIDDLSVGTTLTAATEDEIRGGKNLVIAGSGEIFAFESVVDNGGGNYDLVGLWRGLFDSKPSDQANGQQIFFLPDFNTITDAELQDLADSLSRTNWDKVPVAQVRTMIESRTEGPFTGEFQGFDVGLDERSNRPYPPVVGRFAQNGALTTLGVSGGNTFVVDSEVEIEYRTRDRRADLIARPDDPSEVYSAITTDVVSVTSQMTATPNVVGVPGPVYIPPDELVEEFVRPAVVDVLPGSVSQMAGRLRFELRAEEGASLVSINNLVRNSYFAAEFRNRVKNPLLLINAEENDSFKTPFLWTRSTTDDGTALFPISMRLDGGAYYKTRGINGIAHSFNDAQGDLQISQTIDLSDTNTAVARTILSTWKVAPVQNVFTNAYPDMVWRFYNASDSLLSTVTKTPTDTDHTDGWDYQEDTIAVPANAIYCTLTLETSQTTGSVVYNNITDIRGYLIPNSNAERASLTNGDFSSGTTGWTVSDMQSGSGGPANLARFDSTATTPDYLESVASPVGDPEAYQEVTLPASYEAGDLAIFEVSVSTFLDDTIEVYIAAYDNTTLLTTETATLVPLDTYDALDVDQYEAVRVFLKIPEDCDKVRVGFKMSNGSNVAIFDGAALWFLDADVPDTLLKYNVNILRNGDFNDGTTGYWTKPDGIDELADVTATNPWDTGYRPDATYTEGGETSGLLQEVYLLDDTAAGDTVWFQYYKRTVGTTGSTDIVPTWNFYCYDIDNVLLNTFSHTATVASSIEWEFADYTFTAPTATARIDVEYLTDEESSDLIQSTTSVDEFQMRLLPGTLSSQQLTNTSFDTDTSGWTETDSWTRYTTQGSAPADNVVGTHFILPDADPSPEITQTITSIPGSYGTGDYFYLHSIVAHSIATGTKDSMDMRIEILNSSDSVIQTDTFSHVWPTGYSDGDWLRFENEVTLPANAAKVRVTFIGVLNVGTIANCGLDDCRAYFFPAP